MTKNSKILIVDDDSDLRNFVRLSIDNGKRDIVEAETALDGLHAANESPPDILLLDIGLPGHFNGFSLCEALARDPRHHKLRVVVISGHGEAEDIEQAKRLGVVAYIVKPFSPTTLVDLIDDLEAHFNEMLTIVP
jgi:CheY-like chemotaxis protein